MFIEAQGLYGQIASGGASAIPAIAWVRAALAHWLPSLTINLTPYIQQVLGLLIGNIGPIFSGVLSAAGTIFLSFFALYYFLKDGSALHETIVKRGPLGETRGANPLAAVRARRLGDPRITRGGGTVRRLHRPGIFYLWIAERNPVGRGYDGRVVHPGGRSIARGRPGNRLALSWRTSYWRGGPCRVGGRRVNGDRGVPSPKTSRRQGKNPSDAHAFCRAWRPFVLARSDFCSGRSRSGSCLRCLKAIPCSIWKT